MKIRDIVKIIKTYEMFNRKNDELVQSAHTRTWDESLKEHLELDKSYENWLNQDIEAIHDSDVDDATHITNMRILNLLRTYLDKNPQIRFGQALVNLGIIRCRSVSTAEHYIGDYAIDPYYDKSEDILNRVKERVGNEISRES